MEVRRRCDHYGINTVNTSGFRNRHLLKRSVDTVWRDEFGVSRSPRDFCIDREDACHKFAVSIYTHGSQVRGADHRISTAPNHPNAQPPSKATFQLIVQSVTPGLVGHGVRRRGRIHQKVKLFTLSLVKM